MIGNFPTSPDGLYTYFVAYRGFVARKSNFSDTYSSDGEWVASILIQTEGAVADTEGMSKVVEKIKGFDNTAQLHIRRGQEVMIILTSVNLLAVPAQ